MRQTQSSLFVLLFSVFWSAATYGALIQYDWASVKDCSIAVTVTNKDNAIPPELDVRITNIAKQTLVLEVSPISVQYVFRLERFDQEKREFVPLAFSIQKLQRYKTSGAVLSPGKSYSDKIDLSKILPKLEDGKYTISIGRVIDSNFTRVKPEFNSPIVARCRPVEFLIQKK